MEATTTRPAAALPEEAQPEVYTAARLIGEFTQESVSKFGELTTFCKTWTVEKINSSTYQSQFNSISTKWNENEETIFKVIFGIGCFFNFYYSPIFFAFGTIVGFLASTPVPLIQYNCLQNAGCLGYTSEEGYIAQKVMGVITGINLYLGNTFFDNAFGGWFSGIVLGHVLNKQLADTAFGEQANIFSTYLARNINHYLGNE